MVEETRQQEHKSDGKSALATILKVAIGLILLALGGWALLTWWSELQLIVKGTLGLFLVLAGIIALAIAKE